MSPSPLRHQSIALGRISAVPLYGRDALLFGKVAPELGHHLKFFVRTGTTCRDRPDRENAWETD